MKLKSIAFNTALVLIISSVLSTFFGCSDYKYVDGVKISTKYDVDEEITIPILEIVKKEIDDSLVLDCTVMATPTAIDFEFTVTDKSAKNIAEKINSINTGITELMQKNKEDYNLLDCVWLDLHGTESDNKIISVRTGYNLYIYNKQGLEILKNLADSDYDSYYYLYNLSGETLPEECSENLLNLGYIKTYIKSNDDLKRLSQFKKSNTLSIAIMNDTDLSLLLSCEAVESLDLYLFSDTDISPLSSFKNLKKLYIASGSIDKYDIEALKKALPDCIVSSDDKMEVFEY